MTVARSTFDLRLLWAVVLAAIAVSFGSPGLQQPAADAAPAFAVYEVFVDAGPGSRPLGAFQFEWRVRSGKAQVVGIEGGDGVFAPAPYYDAAALRGGRVVIGAFALAGERPSGRACVARVHVMSEAGVPPEFAVALQACADDRGETMAATIDWRRMESKR